MRSGYPDHDEHAEPSRRGSHSLDRIRTVSDEMREFAGKMLESFGVQVYFDDEKLVDIATALSASGPAYVFVFIEALVDGAVQLGMTNTDARALAIQMVLGSASLAKETANTRRVAQHGDITGRYDCRCSACPRGRRFPQSVNRRRSRRVHARRRVGEVVGRIVALVFRTPCERRFKRAAATFSRSDANRLKYT